MKLRLLGACEPLHRPGGVASVLDNGDAWGSGDDGSNIGLMPLAAGRRPSGVRQLMPQVPPHSSVFSGERNPMLELSWPGMRVWKLQLRGSTVTKPSVIVLKLSASGSAPMSPAKRLVGGGSLSTRPPLTTFRRAQPHSSSAFGSGGGSVTYASTSRSA